MSGVYIGFSKGGNVLSRLICWVTRSDISHAAVVYRDTLWGGWWVAEANAHGVHTRPMDKRTWRYLFEPRYDIVPDLQGAKRYIDDHYDFLGLIMFGWVMLCWRLLRLRVKFPLRSPSGQVCSEFAARVARRAIGGKDPQWISPIDLKMLLTTDTLSLYLPVDPAVLK